MAAPSREEKFMKQRKSSLLSVHTERSSGKTATPGAATIKHKNRIRTLVPAGSGTLDKLLSVLRLAKELALVGPSC